MTDDDLSEESPANAAETPDDDPRGKRGWSPEDGGGYVPEEEGGPPFQEHFDSADGDEPAIFTLSDVQAAVRAVHERANEERPDDDVPIDDDEWGHAWADGVGSGATLVLMEITPSGGCDDD